MKVLANDGLHKDGIEYLAVHGFDVDLLKRNPENLVTDIGDFDALVVRSATDVTKEVIEAGYKGKLQVIGRAGVGVDNVDHVAAAKRGIIVKNAPYGNTNAAAELAFGLMFDLSRKISQADRALSEGVWKKKEFEGIELTGKTLGVLGCGRIAQRLAELAHGFMDVIGYDPNEAKIRILFPDSPIKYRSDKEVLQQSDYLSIHVGPPVKVLGREQLALIKPSCYIINTARAANMDNEALYNAIAAGQIAGAALDVHEEEPGEGREFYSRFKNLEGRVILTPHLGASTDRAQRDTSIEIAQAVESFFRGDYSNAVNALEPVEEEKAVYPIMVFHKDMPGMFAAVTLILAEAGVNLREIPSTKLSGDGDALATVQAHQKVGPKVIAKLEAIQGVYRVRLGY